jgi:hypothetical protein
LAFSVPIFRRLKEMLPLLTARVRFRKGGVLHEGWHAVECKKLRADYGIALELLVGHITEALHKLDAPITESVSVDIQWADVGTYQRSMVGMLLPDISTKKHVRRYYTVREQ